MQYLGNVYFCGSPFVYMSRTDAQNGLDLIVQNFSGHNILDLDIACLFEFREYF